MSDEDRVYFIGAGASKQDRFPLTSELKHGIAWAVLGSCSDSQIFAFDAWEESYDILNGRV
jgi:hypothetical protein